MTYFPRIRPRGSGARYSDGMPACGAIAGLLAQRDRRGLWAAPEPSDFVLRAAMVPVAEVDAGAERRLVRYGINAFVPGTDRLVRFAGSVTLGSMGRGRGSTLSLGRRRLALFILASIESAACDAAAEAKPTFAVTRLEAQLRRFFDDLYLRGALEGRTPDQAYYLHPSQSAPDARSALRLGFALAEPGQFAEYSIELEGEKPGRLLPAGAIEAAQLYS